MILEKYHKETMIFVVIDLFKQLWVTRNFVTDLLQ